VGVKTQKMKRPPDAISAFTLSLRCRAERTFSRLAAFLVGISRWSISTFAQKWIKFLTTDWSNSILVKLFL
jgi:hypothetical protein